VELYQQLLWQIEFSWWEKYNLCWAFFSMDFNEIVPLQVLRDGRAQEPNDSNATLRISSTDREGLGCEFPQSHWSTDGFEVGTESWISFAKRKFGMMVLKAELKSTKRPLHNSQVCWGDGGSSSIQHWLHHPQNCLLCRQTEGDPAPQW